MSKKPVIAVHGGAWSIPEHLSKASVDGVKVAARAGHAVLIQGGSAVDAVEEAVKSMEDDPAFDAGTGSVLNIDGDVEMDAVIMDGKDLNCGAVACIHSVKNPIQVARLVMDKSDHVLLYGIPGGTLPIANAKWERQIKRILRRLGLGRRGQESSEYDIVPAVISEIGGSSRRFGIRLMHQLTVRSIFLAKEILEFPDVHSIVLEEDGTALTSDDVLASFDKATVMALNNNQCYTPSSKSKDMKEASCNQESVPVDDVCARLELIRKKRLHVRGKLPDLLVGKGANKFAEEMKIESVTTKQLVTEEAVREWENFHKFKLSVDTFLKQATIGHDTVGAVALDGDGNVAFATSTGGINAKKVGRVGDSPIIGSGGYADNNSGAVSSTGHGESIMKMCLAKNITYLLEQGKNVQEAAEMSLSAMTSRVHGSGGVIVVDKEGNVAQHFTTEKMAWAWIKEDQLSYGLNPSEHYKEDLNT